MAAEPRPLEFEFETVEVSLTAGTLNDGPDTAGQACVWARVKLAYTPGKTRPGLGALSLEVHGLTAEEALRQLPLGRPVRLTLESLPA